MHSVPPTRSPAPQRGAQGAGMRVERGAGESAPAQRMPIVQCPAHGGDGSASHRSRLASAADAAMGGGGDLRAAVTRSRRPRPPPRPHTTRNPLPNRLIVALPAVPGRCCSPASTKFFRWCVRPVAARSASSPSSPTPRRCVTSSATSASRPRHAALRQPVARRYRTCRSAERPVAPENGCLTRPIGSSAFRLARLNLLSVRGRERNPEACDRYRLHPAPIRAR